jgi:serine protease Do
MKAIYLFAAALFPAAIMAQTPEKRRDAEQIIITKKGTDDQKLNIVIDGDNITVNGKPVANDKDSVFTISRKKIKDLSAWRDDSDHNVIVQGYGINLNKAMLGVSTQKTDNGVEVMSVVEKSAAAMAGLKTGDVITEVDKQKITVPDELSKVINAKKPGDKISVVYLRDKKQNTVIAELKKWEMNYDIMGFNFSPKEFNIDSFKRNFGEGYRMDMPNIGTQPKFRIGDSWAVPTPNNRDRIVLGYSLNKPKLGITIQEVETGSGVKVIEVEKKSDAEKAGIKAGDVITEVDGKSITGTDDMRTKILGAKKDSSIKIKLLRNGKQQSIDVKLSKPLKTAEL